MDGGRYQAVEYAGEAMRALPMQERMTLSNMAAELGAQAGLIAPDETTAAYVSAARGRSRRLGTLAGRCRGAGGRAPRFDAAALAPQVAAPHSPANATDVGEQAGQALDVVYIGACTGAKYHDLAAAAEILRGKQAGERGRSAGRPGLGPRPGSCRGRRHHGGLRGGGRQDPAQRLRHLRGLWCVAARRGRACLSSTARNFRGRMGDASTGCGFARPIPAAASAVEGRIADPRNHLEGA